MRFANTTVLMTSLPVETFEHAWQVISDYENRWLIEEYHKVLKTGCSIERHALRTADCLEPLIGLIMPQFGTPSMSYRTLLPGRTYRFLYPSINFNCLIMSGLDERRVLVERVRDTELELLDDETLESNPFIKRGRWLVTGINLEKGEERSFYVESMVAVVEIGDHFPIFCLRF